MEGNGGRSDGTGRPEEESPGPPPAPETPEAEAGAHGMAPPSGVPGGFGDQETPSERPRGPARARLVALVTALVLAFGAAAVAVVIRGQDVGAELDDVVPAGAIFYAKANLAPGGDQGTNLRRILDRFEQDGRSAGDRFAEFLEQELAQDDISFDRDIRSWLGPQVAFVVPSLNLAAPGGPEPQFAVVASVRDEGAARSALQRLRDASEEPMVFEVKEGAAFIAPDLPTLERVLGVLDRDERSMAEDQDYRDGLGRVGGDNVAVLWFDGRAFAQLVPPDFLPQLPGGFGDLSGTAIMAVRALPDAIELTGYGPAGEEATGLGVPRLVEGAPGDLMGSFTLFDLAGTFDRTMDAFEAFMGFGGGTFGAAMGGIATLPQQVPSVREMVDGFLRQNLGLRLDEDLLPWLGGEFSVVVGRVTLIEPEVGFLIESTDDAAARRTIDGLRERLPVFGRLVGFEVTGAQDGFALSFEEGFSLIVRRVAGRVVIATTDSYAERLLAGSPESLGADAVYQRTVGDAGASDVAMQMHLRIDRIVDLLRLFLPPSELQDADPILREFEAVGMRATQSGNESVFRMVVTFKPN